MTEKTFESAMAELEIIVKKFDQAQVPLGDLIKEYARAQELRAFCAAELDKAKGIIEQVTSGHQDS